MREQASLDTSREPGCFYREDRKADLSEIKARRSMYYDYREREKQKLARKATRDGILVCLFLLGVLIALLW